MAQFIAGVKGARGVETRLGHKTTGVFAWASGWGIGGEVEMRYNPDTGRDVVSFSLGGGSNGPKAETLIEFTTDAKGNQRILRVSEYLQRMLREIGVAEVTK